MTEPFVKLKDRCFVATVLPTLLLLLLACCQGCGGCSADQNFSKNRIDRFFIVVFRLYFHDLGIVACLFDYATCYLRGQGGSGRCHALLLLLLLAGDEGCCSCYNSGSLHKCGVFRCCFFGCGSNVHGIIPGWFLSMLRYRAGLLSAR